MHYKSEGPVRLGHHILVMHTNVFYGGNQNSFFMPRNTWTDKDEAIYTALTRRRMIARQCVSTTEAAKLLGIARTNVWVLCKSGALRFYPLNGGCLGVTRDSIRAYQAQQGSKQGRGHYTITVKQAREIEQARRHGLWPDWVEEHDVRVRAKCKVCGTVQGTRGKRGKFTRYPLKHYPPRETVLPGMIRRRCPGSGVAAEGWEGEGNAGY